MSIVGGVYLSSAVGMANLKFGSLWNSVATHEHLVSTSALEAFLHSRNKAWK